MSFQPSISAKQAAILNELKQFLLVTGPRKASKCVDGDTIVSTESGPKRMRRVVGELKTGGTKRINSAIEAFDGLSTILSVARGAIHESDTAALHVVTESGYSVKCSLRHPLWCKVGEANWGWVKSPDILEAIRSGHPILTLTSSGAMMGWARQRSFKTVHVYPKERNLLRRIWAANKLAPYFLKNPSSTAWHAAKATGVTFRTAQRCIDNPPVQRLVRVDLSDEAAYLLGLLAGDGCMTPKVMANGCIQFSTEDVELRDVVMDLTSRLFKANFRHSKGCDYSISSPVLNAVIVKLGMNKHAHDKRIPDEILESPRSVVVSFLRGLFDTDGCATNRRHITFCSASESLARDVHTLLLMLGIRGKLKFRKNRCRGAWHLNICADVDIFNREIGFGLTRKRLRSEDPKAYHRKKTPKLHTENVVSCEVCTADLYDISVPGPHSFIANGLINHNTIGCEHALPWHLWNTPRAVGMMLGNTISQNSDSGPWAHLISNVIPQWVDGGFGMELITPPRMEATTHKLYFEVTNKFYEDEGPRTGVSRMYLDSLDIEDNAEDKFKGKFFSLIYWTELSNFKKRKTFDVLQECLRCDWLKPEQQRLIADTNPADEGEDSWIWKLWYWFRTLDLSNLSSDAIEDLNLSDVSDEDWDETILGLKELQEQLVVHEFSIDDNIFLTPKQKRAQKAKYSHDRDLLDRYYYGKWVRASGVGIFSSEWNPTVHVVGERSSPSDPVPDILLPESNCIELGTGWDIGPRNVAVGLIEKVIVEVPGVDEDGKDILVPKPGFKILDEYVRLGEAQKVSTVTRRIMEKMASWEEEIGRAILWKHKSDRSAFEKYDNIADSYEHLEVNQESNGIITLEAVIKGAGSVERRIEMMQRLLFEQRLWVSQAKCPNVVEMFGAMKRNNANKLSTTNIYKHIFDAISYYICMECWTEIQRGPRLRTSRDNSRIITTSL